MMLINIRTYVRTCQGIFLAFDNICDYQEGILSSGFTILAAGPKGITSNPALSQDNGADIQVWGGCPESP